LLVACSGPSLDGGTWKVGDASFVVGPVPKDWRRIDSPGSSIAFRDDKRAGTVIVNARCNNPSDDAPLVALTNHLLMGSTERDVKSQEIVPFDSREAMHTIVYAKLDGVLMAYDIYVLKKNNCVYDFVYVASPAHFDAGTAAFEGFVSGFHTQ
jgi:hypothetical protein